MKRLFTSKLWIAFVILIIFISGQLLGAFSIKHYFLESKIEELQPSLSLISDELADGGKISRTDDFYVKAYDVQGRKIDVYTDTAETTTFDDAKLDKVLLSQLPKIISGNMAAEIKEVPGYSGRAILIGQPLVKENQVTGAVYLMKEARAYQAALNGFYFVFFLRWRLVH